MDTSFDYIYGMPDSGTYFMDANVVIASGVDFAVSDIVVMGSHILVNNGVVNTDIDICDGCRLEIYNRGVFSADFSLGDNASVVQVISGVDDLSGLDINVDYTIRVDGADGLRLSEVMRVGSVASEVLLADSFVVWDMYNLDTTKLKLLGDIKLEFNDIESILGRVVLSNVSPDAYVQIVSDGIVNPMFALKTYVDDSNVYSVLVRETDYTKILDNNLGRFVNSLRTDSSAYGLLNALDNAMSMDSLNQIMADSVRIASINLMKSVAMFNAFNMNDFSDGFGMRANYVMADEFDVYGLMLDASVSDTGVCLYTNRISAENYGDVFSGMMFGGDARVRYENNVGFVRGMIGGNITLFDISNVFDEAVSVDNPTGYSMYGAFDIGRNIYSDNGFFVSPYVGGTLNYMKILNQNESDCLGRAGVEAGYNFEMLGIKYDYTVRANIDTNTDVFIAGRIGFMSLIDMIGGYAEVGLIDNKIGQGYKISAGLDFVF